MSIVVKGFHLVRSLTLRLHKCYLKQVFGACGVSLQVHGKTWVINGSNVEVGDEVHLNHGCLLNALEPITIGSRVHLSAYAQLHTGGLGIGLEERGNHHCSSIILEDDVWIGANAIILPGVVVGSRSVVAAGAVVVKSIPRGELWGGVPARRLKSVG